MRGSTFWGIILVLVGIVFLLNSMGLLAVNAWNIIWPLFLVVLGIWCMWGAFFGRGSVKTEQAAISLEGAARARVRVNHGAGRLQVGAAALGDRLLDGTFGGGLRYRSSRRGDELDVRMRIRGGNFWGPWSWSPGALDWDFKLNDAIPLALEFEVGASDSHLDLTNLRVTDLSVRTGASATEVTLPANAGQTRADMHAGAASLVVRIPQGVAARIRARGGLSGITVDTARFPRSGDTYQSPDYSTAPNRIDLDVELGVGSFDVR